MCRTMAILALSFALPLAVDAFDGQREGFLLSIGLGGGQRTIEESISPSEAPNIINPIKTTDLVTAYEMKIGYGLSNSLIVGLNINAANGTYQSKIFENPRSTASFNITGLGLTYFFADRAPSVFIEAIFGMASWQYDIDDDGDSPLVSSGMACGLGYEFRKNWTLEIDAGWGSPKETTGIFAQLLGRQIEGLKLSLTAHHIWY